MARRRRVIAARSGSTPASSSSKVPCAALGSSAIGLSSLRLEFLERDSRSLRIVENHADGMAMTGAQSAHAMPQVHAVSAAHALHWPVAYREDHAVATPKRHHFGPRLHPRPLLGQHELAAGEVFLRFR